MSSSEQIREADDVAIDLSRNVFLEQLPQEDLAKLHPFLEVDDFAQGQVLVDAGKEIESVYFPLSGMISLVIVMRDGKMIETATIGRENVFGAMVGFGENASQVRAVVQVSLTAARISAARFRKLAEENTSLQRLTFNSNRLLLAQTRISVACNALHKVEERFCRWLLQTRDTVDGDTIVLTQEFLSEMLGVRRTSVTDVASKLQSAGVISYSRGVIKILDIERLKAMSCECYDTLRRQERTLTGLLPLS